MKRAFLGHGFAMYGLMACLIFSGGEAYSAKKAPVKKFKPGDVIPGRYIVLSRSDVDAVELARSYEIKSGRSFKHGIKGFAAFIDDVKISKLKQDPRVALVEPDRYAGIEASGTQLGATWGLDRIDQRVRVLDSKFNYNFTGKGVTAYVIDTGIRHDHSEFRDDLGNSRASFGYDGIAANDLQGGDCNGHGTHVAGTIGGKSVGVAKDVSLVSVRIFDCSGGSAYSTIISGIDWVVGNRKLPAVANLSLGGGVSLALDMAIQRLVQSGVITVVAAGNDGKDACSYSPARAVNAITVGASDSFDARASYSNYGSCVDLFAPGSAIQSAWFTGATAYNTISGTSMATPHVAGVAALHLETRPETQQVDMRDLLLASSSKGVVTNSLSTNNHLLFTEDQSMGTGDYKSPTNVWLTSHFNGATVKRGSKNVLKTSAVDNVKLSKVEYRMNGVVACSSIVAPFSCTWTAPRTAQTVHIDIKATDSAGNSAGSPYVMIQVQ